VAGAPMKCASPASAIERAKGFWQVLGHAGAVALVSTGYPESEITVLRQFGSVPDDLSGIRPQRLGLAQALLRQSGHRGRAARPPRARRGRGDFDRHRAIVAEVGLMPSPSSARAWRIDQ